MFTGDGLSNGVNCGPAWPRSTATFALKIRNESSWYT